LMTSMAFILGVTPLVLSSGAGASSRHEIGIGVIGGMIFATFLGLMMIPVFYIIVRRLLGDKLDEVSHHMPHPGADEEAADHGGDHDAPPADQGPAGGDATGGGPKGEGAPA